MKYSFIIFWFLIISFYSYAQKITRGPDVGEIYFLGPAATDVLYGAIYHSTDYGETAVCVDSITVLNTTIYSISADKTAGGLYYSTLNDLLYFSYNYGSFGSWEYKNYGYFSILCSGQLEGNIFEGNIAHSEDYGTSFINHNLNGIEGNLVWVDIGKNEKGFTLTHIYPTDSLCFYISNDHFNNNQLAHVFSYYGSGSFYYISTADDDAGVYYYNTKYKEIMYSHDDGSSWTTKNQFTCPNLPIEGITGGKQDGEIYLLVVYRQLMGAIRHVYIYHSLDYGETFTVHHPISIGPNPIYANFITEDTLIEHGDTVHFTDLSNDAENWEWDFDNDGVIDSYEQNPTHIYQDTGYYSVKLSITGGAIQDFGIRYNYIHVVKTTGIDESYQTEFICYPNPCSDYIIFDFKDDINACIISIFDISGRHIKTIHKQTNTEKVIWKGTDNNGIKCKAGVYFIKTPGNTFFKKVILTG